MKIAWKALLLGIVSMTLLVACGAASQPETAAGNGDLEFRANGEDFVRQGFESKDGWRIDFDHVYVTLADVAAYQTDPPFDASTGEAPEGEAVNLAGPYTLDLAEGDEDAAPLMIDMAAAPAGQYNAMGWRMVPANDGMSAGATVMMVGTAQKDGQTINFNIKVNDEYTYNCGEYVGDERKGFLDADSNADLEATFHFDHVFGDGEAPADDGLNVGALGFDPLASLAQNDTLDVDMAALEAGLTTEEFATLRDTLSSLGHVGEGHCYETVGGYTGHKK